MATRRMMISIPPGLMKLVDKAAAEDFTTRSDIIRAALVWYLRPEGHNPSQEDLEKMLKAQQQRKLRAALKKSLRP